ncbi:hypothetical protein L208DRAFT_1327778, partial [Tricholoma matsutake]
YLQQGITLTGLGTPTFEWAVDAAQEIYRLFDQSFEDGMLESWMTSTTQSTTGCSLNASNRYVTSKKDAPQMVHIPFSPAIDPRGFLEQMLKGSYIHGDDNTVEYYQVYKNQDGTRRFQAVGPHTFCIGDIIEIQVSFIVVPLKEQKYKMLVVLHSITLLNKVYSQVSICLNNPRYVLTSNQRN